MITSLVESALFKLVEYELAMYLHIKTAPIYP